ncbi:hypothetical protein LSTR_LSTR013873 [Laodelphax striatellus]|uniref:dolichyl-phosphate-mannose--protein mannosyltransferase n=1 Tax=Laodelphax striatellus TaxID=195883 RepID=A0A482XBY4_LAOST|nr:hypothetical protein LSTR_LSTR013873 [Laodelphax striatellus]
MGSLPSFQVVDNPASFIENSALRTINYFYLYSLNAWLLLCPDWLCFDWSMGCVPLITTLSDSRILAVVVFLFLLFGVCLTVINIEDSKLQRAASLALIIMLVTFLPASNLFFKVGFVVAERVLYLPSIGYCLLVSIGVQKLASNVSSNTQHKVLRICVCLLIFVFLARSVRRSAEWRTEKDLFRSAISVCPLNAKVHYNMGKVADSRTMAIKHYRDAIALNPDYDQAMNNLANILKDIGELDEAEMYLRKAVQLRSDFAAAWMNLGIVLSNKEQFEEAEKCFHTALKYRSHYPDCYYNLGNLYLGKKMFTEAYNVWQKAISQNPKHVVAWNNIIIMLDSLGEYGKAEDMANEALKLIPNDAGLHFNLANALGKLSRFEESEERFLQAIRLKPDQPLYYVNLGVLYHRWKKFEKAKLMYQRALKLNPNSESALRNLKMLQ